MSQSVLEQDESKMVPREYEDLKDRAFEAARKADELKKLYEDQAKEADSAGAALEAAKSRKCKESNKDRMAQDLKNLLKQKKEAHWAYHQSDMEALQRLQKKNANKKAEEFKTEQAKVKEQHIQAARQTQQSKQELRLSGLKKKQDLELAELLAKHKHERDVLLAPLEQEHQKSLSHLAATLDVELAQGLDRFLSAMESENRTEQERAREKFRIELQAFEEKINQMINEVDREPLVNM